VDLNGLNVTIFVEEGLAVYVVSRDMVLRDIDSANLEYVSVVVKNEVDMENAHSWTSVAVLCCLCRECMTVFRLLELGQCSSS